MVAGPDSASLQRQQPQHRRLPTTVEDLFDGEIASRSVLFEDDGAPRTSVVESGAATLPGDAVKTIVAEFTSSRFFDDPDSPVVSDGEDGSFLLYPSRQSKPAEAKQPGDAKASKKKKKKKNKTADPVGLSFERKGPAAAFAAQVRDAERVGDEADQHLRAGAVAKVEVMNSGLTQYKKSEAAASVQASSKNGQELSAVAAVMEEQLRGQVDEQDGQPLAAEAGAGPQTSGSTAAAIEIPAGNLPAAPTAAAVEQQQQQQQVDEEEAEAPDTTAGASNAALPSLEDKGTAEVAPMPEVSATHAEEKASASPVPEELPVTDAATGAEGSAAGLQKHQQQHGMEAETVSGDGPDTTKTGELTPIEQAIEAQDIKEAPEQQQQQQQQDEDVAGKVGTMEVQAHAGVQQAADSQEAFTTLASEEVQGQQRTEAGNAAEAEARELPPPGKEGGVLMPVLADQGLSEKESEQPEGSASQADSGNREESVADDDVGKQLAKEERQEGAAKWESKEEDKGVQELACEGPGDAAALVSVAVPMIATMGPEDEQAAMKHLALLMTRELSKVRTSSAADAASEALGSAPSTPYFVEEPDDDGDYMGAPTGPATGATLHSAAAATAGLHGPGSAPGTPTSAPGARGTTGEAAGTTPGWLPGQKRGGPRLFSASFGAGAAASSEALRGDERAFFERMLFMLYNELEAERAKARKAEAAAAAAARERAAERERRKQEERAGTQATAPGNAAAPADAASSEAAGSDGGSTGDAPMAAGGPAASKAGLQSAPNAAAAAAAAAGTFQNGQFPSTEKEWEQFLQVLKSKMGPATKQPSDSQPGSAKKQQQPGSSSYPFNPSSPRPTSAPEHTTEGTSTASAAGTRVAGAAAGSDFVRVSSPKVVQVPQATPEATAAPASGPAASPADEQQPAAAAAAAAPAPTTAAAAQLQGTPVLPRPQQSAAYQAAPYVNQPYSAAQPAPVLQHPGTATAATPPGTVTTTVPSGPVPGPVSAHASPAGLMPAPPGAAAPAAVPAAVTQMATRVVYQQAVYQTPQGLVYATIPVVQQVPVATVPPMQVLQQQQQQQQQQAARMQQQAPSVAQPAAVGAATALPPQQQQQQQQAVVAQGTAPAGQQQQQQPVYHPGPIPVAGATPQQQQQHAAAANEQQQPEAAPAKRRERSGNQSWGEFSVFTGQSEAPPEKKKGIFKSISSKLAGATKSSKKEQQQQQQQQQQPAAKATYVQPPAPAPVNAKSFIQQQAMMQQQSMMQQQQQQAMMQQQQQRGMAQPQMPQQQYMQPAMQPQPVPVQQQVAQAVQPMLAQAAQPMQAQGMQPTPAQAVHTQPQQQQQAQPVHPAPAPAPAQQVQPQPQQLPQHQQQHAAREYMHAPRADQGPALHPNRPAPVSLQQFVQTPQQQAASLSQHQAQQQAQPAAVPAVQQQEQHVPLPTGAEQQPLQQQQQPAAPNPAAAPATGGGPEAAQAITQPQQNTIEGSTKLTVQPQVQQQQQQQQGGQRMVTFKTPYGTITMTAQEAEALKKQYEQEEAAAKNAAQGKGQSAAQATAAGAAASSALAPDPRGTHPNAPGAPASLAPGVSAACAPQPATTAAAGAGPAARPSGHSRSASIASSHASSAAGSIRSNGSGHAHLTVATTIAPGAVAAAVPLAPAVPSAAALPGQGVSGAVAAAGSSVVGLQGQAMAGQGVPSAVHSRSESYGGSGAGSQGMPTLAPPSCAGSFSHTASMAGSLVGSPTGSSSAAAMGQGQAMTLEQLIMGPHDGMSHYAAAIASPEGLDTSYSIVHPEHCRDVPGALPAAAVLAGPTTQYAATELPHSREELGGRLPEPAMPVMMPTAPQQPQPHPKDRGPSMPLTHSKYSAVPITVRSSRTIRPPEGPSPEELQARLARLQSQLEKGKLPEGLALAEREQATAAQKKFATPEQELQEIRNRLKQTVAKAELVTSKSSSSLLASAASGSIASGGLSASSSFASLTRGNSMRAPPGTKLPNAAGAGEVFHSPKPSIAAAPEVYPHDLQPKETFHSPKPSLTAAPEVFPQNLQPKETFHSPKPSLAAAPEVFPQNLRPDDKASFHTPSHSFTGQVPGSFQQPQAMQQQQAVQQPQQAPQQPQQPPMTVHHRQISRSGSGRLSMHQRTSSGSLHTRTASMSNLGLGVNAGAGSGAGNGQGTMHQRQLSGMGSTYHTPSGSFSGEMLGQVATAQAQQAQQAQHDGAPTQLQAQQEGIGMQQQQLQYPQQQQLQYPQQQVQQQQLQYPQQQQQLQYPQQQQLQYPQQQHGSGSGPTAEPGPAAGMDPLVQQQLEYHQQQMQHHQQQQMMMMAGSGGAAPEGMAGPMGGPVDRVLQGSQHTPHSPISPQFLPPMAFHQPRSSWTNKDYELLARLQGNAPQNVRRTSYPPPPKKLLGGASEPHVQVNPSSAVVNGMGVPLYQVKEKQPPSHWSDKEAALLARLQNAELAPGGKKKKLLSLPVLGADGSKASKASASSSSIKLSTWGGAMVGK